MNLAYKKFLVNLQMFWELIRPPPTILGKILKDHRNFFTSAYLCEFGNFGKLVILGILVILVNPVILVNMVILTNLVILVNLAILAVLVIQVILVNPVILVNLVILATMTHCQDHILTENIWFFWSKLSYSGGKGPSHQAGRDDDDERTNKRR